MVEKSQHREGRRKLFGRRKGPALSPHQARLIETLLPKLALSLDQAQAPAHAFASSVDDVWLEVGYGAGEHLLWQAAHHPRVGLIGAEPYISGIAKLLSKMAAPSVALANARTTPPPQAGEENTITLSSPVYGGGPVEDRGGGSVPTNIRLYEGDARDLLDVLPDQCLGRVFILFPDPWPKTRHHKRRFIQMETLDQLARVMKRHAELRFASDDADYLNWTLERLMAHPAFAWTAECAGDWRTRSSDWPQTRYEAKALHGVPAFLRFVRI